MSIATDTSVKTVICFDRAATVLFGCSADEFFHFTKLNPLAGKDSSNHLTKSLMRFLIRFSDDSLNVLFPLQHQRLIRSLMEKC